MIPRSPSAHLDSILLNQPLTAINEAIRQMFGREASKILAHHPELSNNKIDTWVASVILHAMNGYFSVGVGRNNAMAPVSNRTLLESGTIAQVERNVAATNDSTYSLAA